MLRLSQTRKPRPRTIRWQQLLLQPHLGGQKRHCLIERSWLVRPAQGNDQRASERAEHDQSRADLTVRHAGEIEHTARSGTDVNLLYAGADGGCVFWQAPDCHRVQRTRK